jgi:hypothetical protein
MRYQIISGLTASLLLAGGALCAPKAVRKSEAVGDRQITIRIHDYAHANPSVLSRGERAVDDILQQAGVAAVWIDCSVDLPNAGDARCSRPVSPVDFVLNLLPRSKSDRLRRPAGVLGFAAEASGRGFGFITSIFYDVVKDCATQRQEDFGELLGDAIAHELGHLLLGTNSHSSRGLMCAFWSGNQLRIAAQRGLAFSDTETQRIQAAMTARVLAATAFPQEGQSLVTDSSSRMKTSWPAESSGGHRLK